MFVGCTSTSASKDGTKQNNPEARITKLEQQNKKLQTENDRLRQQQQELARTLRKLREKMDSGGQNNRSGTSDLDLEIPDRLQDKIKKITVNGRTGLRLENIVLFGSGSAQLTEAGKKAVEQIVPVLNELDEEMVFRVEGHTDNVPIEESGDRFPTNWHLSAARAITVARHLINKGISRKRIQVVGHADVKPIASNENAEGRKKNRRVEITIMPGS